MTLLIILFILLALSYVLPMFSNLYRENLWKYIKEKMEFEKESERIKSEIKRRKGNL